MNHEIYTALSGALANDRRQEITANNLANVNSGGFRRDIPMFATVYDQVSGNNRQPENEPMIVEHNCFAVHAGNWIDFQTGAMQDTGNPLDMALDGEGFFVMKRVGDGKIYYTRDGHFRLNEQREMVAMNGDQVMAAGEEDVALILAGENPGALRDLKIGKLGDVMVDGQSVGALRLMTFPDLQGLEKLGDAGFVESAASGPPEPAAQLEVNQGVRELSNVNTLEEMVSLIEIARQYEAQQKIIVGLDEINKQAAKGIIG
ncbi:MAG: flagellar hook basal-body protein [Deltaproteobacteria bacterium]|nr:flagellar hook basal-body protein [Candidatus Tharpella aukensis]